MARAVRIQRPGGRYHVTARGNERKPIYREDRDREHFLTLLGELAERFGVRIHAYTLMDNHYHLLVETPEANLSRAMQWLNVSYREPLAPGIARGWAGSGGSRWAGCAEAARRRNGGRLSARTRSRRYGRGAVAWPWDRLVAGLVLGTEDFARRLREGLGGNAREQGALKRREPRCGWPAIVKAVTAVKGEQWEDFKERHGDWGRDAALWLGRRRGRYSLGELGQLAEGMDYAAVGQAVSRFGRRLARELALRRRVGKIERQISNVEM